ncbi:MAG TPA: polyphosphate kinase 1 [Fimbriimonadaceae bacterium]|nr:polyphosphate kinase 1 [Fimbriimonadaceae bacterium]
MKSRAKAEAEEKSSPYLNRELSWLQFNRRVLEEAINDHNPLLERLKFLAIFESNLDEFYMVRVSGLIEQFESGILEQSPDGLTPKEQLSIISRAAKPLRLLASQVYEKQIKPALSKAGIAIVPIKQISPKQRKELDEFFYREIFPLCTPLILHPAPSTPFISNRSLNLAVELTDGNMETKLARVKVPSIVPRAVRLPGRKHEYVLLEEIIAENLKFLFPGIQVVGAHLFRVVRDADVEIRQLEAADLIATIEETLKLRRFGDPVLLEVASTMPKRIRKLLMGLLNLDEDDVFSIDGVIGMEVFQELAKVDRPALRFPPHHPFLSDDLATSDQVFDAIAARDVLLQHPYDSFRPVETFVDSAATDPSVIGIKQTLYRVGSESPIVESLLDAAENDKQVASMVELKARFDESNNLVWARTLERAGVHVTYGFAEMKTHCKLCLIVRRERGSLRTYAHIGTGNYNPVTARIYTDLGLFTKDPAITQDISELFNYLTGFSKQTSYRKLLVAPINLREGILQRIQAEIESNRKNGKGRIIFKLNSLVDPEVIDALYVASKTGVKVDLIVRGICCLRPGVAGLSENISVISIVGRFLEHSRIYYFENGGSPEVFIGSADLMRRNLDRRIEVLCPVEQPDHIAHLRDHVLANCLKDNVKAWRLDSKGEYSIPKRKRSEKPFSCQEFFMSEATSKVLRSSL